MNSRRLYPSIASLCTFKSVAQKRSFTAAAKELSLTQGAVSRQIAVLEQQLNCKLFDRTTRSLVLTPVGSIFLAEITPALAQIRDASLNALTNNKNNVATIALLPTFGSRWLMPRMPKFLQKYPDVTLNFTTKIGKFDFRAENIDGAIYYGTPDWEVADLTLLMNERVSPVASPEFLNSNMLNSSADILKMHKLHMKSRPYDWQDWIEANGFMVDEGTGTEFEHFSMVAQACIAGIGIALMPEFLIAPEIQSGKLVLVGETIKTRGAYYFAMPKLPKLPKLNSQNTVAANFKDWIEAEAKRTLIS